MVPTAPYATTPGSGIAARGVRVGRRGESETHRTAGGAATPVALAAITIPITVASAATLAILDST